MRKNKNAGLYVLIAFITALFLSMLVLCGLYLDLRINGISSSLPSIPEKDKWILTGVSYNTDNTSDRLLNPAFVGYKTKENGMLAASFDETARNGLISELDRCIPLLFSGKSNAVNFQNESEKKEFVQGITGSDTFFYLSYYGDIPSAAILPSTQNGSEYNDLNENFYVKYVFILPDEKGNMYGVCFDNSLNAVILETADDFAYGKSEIFTYNGVSGFVPFEFVSSDNPEPVFTRSFEVDSVITVPSASFYTFELEETETRQLLSVFGMNVNLVKNYRSGDNMIVSFVDNGKELYISKKNSSIHYSGYDGGIHMSHFLKYEPQGNEYMFSDAVLCVKYLISLIDRVIIGNDAEPTLVRIDKTGSLITFDLKYFYNGIMLTEDSFDIRITTDGVYIKSVDIKAISCKKQQNKISVIPQKLVVTALNPDERIGNRGYSAMFVSKDNNASTDVVWTVRKEVSADVS